MFDLFVSFPQSDLISTPFHKQLQHSQTKPQLTTLPGSGFAAALEVWNLNRSPQRGDWWWLGEKQIKMKHVLLGGGFKHFFFHPYLGKWSNLTNIFGMGWNHQPVLLTEETKSPGLFFFASGWSKCYRLSWPPELVGSVGMALWHSLFVLYPLDGIMFYYMSVDFCSINVDINKLVHLFCVGLTSDTQPRCLVATFRKKTQVWLHFGQGLCEPCGWRKKLSGRLCFNPRSEK